MRLEEVAKAVGGGYCRLQMPLKPALGVRGTVAGHRLGALEGVGGVPPPEDRVAVQGPVKKQQPDRMSHGGGPPPLLFQCPSNAALTPPPPHLLRPRHMLHWVQHPDGAVFLVVATAAFGRMMPFSFLDAVIGCCSGCRPLPPRPRRSDPRR